MKLIIAISGHFQSRGGEVFSHHLTYERFWKRYLEIFDSVLVVTRVKPVEKIPAGWGKATNSDVEFCALPDYHGPYQFLIQMNRIQKIIQDAIEPGSSFVFRVPDNISTQVWKQIESGYPYGIEIVGDPWDAFAPGSIKSLGRPFYRWLWTRNLRLQCQQASAVSYVTEHALQQRYPPNKKAYATHYSSIDLNSEDLKDDVNHRLAAISTISERLVGDGHPVRLGFIGTFSQTHKLPHVHIEALAQCIAKGANVTLDMIGDGILLKDMKLLAEKLGIGNRVNFLERLPGGKPILDAVDNFDVFLNATATEGLPRVVIEAMSRGCPCIASNVAGTPELLEERYLVPPGNAKKLAETILFVLGDPKVMAKMVHRNITVARKYCKDVLEPRRHAFYETIYKQTEKYLSKRR